MLPYMVKRAFANAMKLQALRWEGNPGTNIITWIREMAVSEGAAALFLLLECRVHIKEPERSLWELRWNPAGCQQENQTSVFYHMELVPANTRITKEIHFSLESPERNTALRTL